jgi:hypothetical protein
MQWQKVLLALVNGRKASLKPHASLTPLDIRTIFRSAGLIDDSHKLTDLGFHFLFLDVYSQLWKLLQQYLMQLQASPEQSLADALSFLLQLSFRKVRSLLPPVSAQQSFEHRLPILSLCGRCMPQSHATRGWASTLPALSVVLFHDPQPESIEIDLLGVGAEGRRQEQVLQDLP